MKSLNASYLHHQFFVYCALHIVRNTVRSFLYSTLKNKIKKKEGKKNIFLFEKQNI